jgi:hypothetical protein
MERLDAIPIIKAPGNTPDPVGLAVVFIIAGFVQDIGKDQKATGKAYGQAEEVDKGNEFILNQVSKCDPEIIFKHNR